jgi:hypothetical protein
MGGTANGESAAAIFAKEGILAFHWFFFFFHVCFCWPCGSIIDKRATASKLALQARGERGYSGDIEERVCVWVATVGGRESRERCVVHM